MDSQFRTINLNDRVTVILKPKGLEILEKAGLSGEVRQGNQWSTLLWGFMSVFAGELNIGFDQPVETTIYLEAVK